MHPAHTVGERRRPRLQDVGRLDLEAAGRPCTAGTVLPSRPRRDVLGPELLAAPGAEHHVRFAPHDLVSTSAMILSLAACDRRPLGKTCLRRRRCRSARHPADAADHAARPTPRNRRGACWQNLSPPRSPRAGPSRDAAPAPRAFAGTPTSAASIWIIERISPTLALVEDHAFHAGLDQVARDVGLQIGKPEDQVGLQLQDFVDLRADRNAETRGFSCRARGGRTV